VVVKAGVGVRGKYEEGVSRNGRYGEVANQLNDPD
jgi:hypothetical protein